MIERLVQLARKPERRIVGLMSGTSMDGIDVAVVRVRGAGAGCEATLEAFALVPYAPGLRARLLRAAAGEPLPTAEHARLHFQVAVAFADATLQVLGAAGIAATDVDAIGTHGQTLFHHAPRGGEFGPGTATYQAGSLPVIAARTGIVTVGDFRPADVALGGTGAPLVPYCDFVLRRSATESRLLLNLGGIANWTVLPAGCTSAQVLAWDVGPGNLVLDGFAQELLGRECDQDGAEAARGTADEAWVEELLAAPYFTQPPPKSAGREQFGAGFVRQLLDDPRARGKTPQDLLATAVLLTARAVADALRRPPVAFAAPGVLYVTGGGRRNRTLMDRLAALAAPVPVRGIEELGVNPDAKEALDFAVLANETLLGHAGNLPRVTGAARPCILGVVSCAGVAPRTLDSA